MALAMAVRTGQDLNGSHWIDAHFGAFPQANASTQRTYCLPKVRYRRLRCNSP